MIFKPVPASSIGLITNYRCSFSCKHCLYCSSPDIEENISTDKIIQIIRTIAGNPNEVALHIGGGEPLLYYDSLKDIIIPEIISHSGIYLEYMETNGLLLLKNTEEKLRNLKKAGLNRILLSISPFHNEFISLANTMKMFEEIVEVFGPNGIFPWHQGYLYYLEKMDTSKTTDPDEYFRELSRRDIVHLLTGIMYIHPGGRAAYLLARYLPVYPPEDLFNVNCRESLSSPVHAHVDYDGNYLAGFCGGIRIGVASSGKEVNLDDYPLLDILIGKGLKELYNFAVREGYEANSNGYVSPCHLCLDIRTYLYHTKKGYTELYPDFFYREIEILRKKHRVNQVSIDSDSKAAIL